MAQVYASRWPRRLIAMLALPLALCGASFAQSATPGKPPEAKTERSRSQFRQLAPGVMKTIAPDLQEDEGVSRHDLIELLAADPSFAERDWSKGKSPARDTVFRRDVWGLEFAFKPIRFMYVDVPAPDGRMQRKLVWYLVYSIRNNSDKPVVFFPEIILVTKDTGKVYPAQSIPLAVPLIRKREDPNRPLLNIHEVSGQIAPTPKGQDPKIWGVATWEDIDPATDFFAIYIQGLTNAYQWSDPPGAFNNGDPPGTGREFFAKTLILNFWRPSDKENEHEKEIRFEDSSWAYGQLTPDGFVAKKPDPAPAAPLAANGEEEANP